MCMEGVCSRAHSGKPIEGGERGKGVALPRDAPPFPCLAHLFVRASLKHQGLTTCFPPSPTSNLTE